MVFPRAACAGLAIAASSVRGCPPREARAGRTGTCVMGKTKRQQHRSKDEDREDSDGTRIARLQELIREEVNLILRNEVRDPRLDGVVITMVELTGDGSCARLWFTAEGDDDKRAAC